MKQYSCGGKVFIVGEYACLEGGPAILGTVAPKFSLTVTHDFSKTRFDLPFASASPAGLYLSARSRVLEGIRLEWIDPYRTPIGVGSSSAQFLLSVAAVHRLQNLEIPKPQELLNLYWEIVGTSQGLKPSGVDVVAQWMGGPVVVRNKPFGTQTLAAWKANASFLLAYTGSKAKTHEHLIDLKSQDFPDRFLDVLEQLNRITLNAVDAWESGDSIVLGSSLNDYQHALFSGGLAPAHFTRQIEAVQKWPGVLGCKGAGAQGGDCILLLVEQTKIVDVSTRLAQVNWEPFVVDWTQDGVTENVLS
ncbi:MAG: hypothetical protein AB1540_04305 [Bdellovibrionota bacterium]